MDSTRPSLPWASVGELPRAAFAGEQTCLCGSSGHCRVPGLSLSVALLPTEHGRHCDCALGPPLHWLQDTRQGPASGGDAERDALRASWLEEKPPDMDPVGSPKEPARQKHVLTCVRSQGTRVSHQNMPVS